MNAAVTRTILTGAVVALLLLASPLAASAAVPASVPSIAQYEGAPIPSSIADLTLRAKLANIDMPLSSEPRSVAEMRGVHPAGFAGNIRVSPPFTANSESWVAIEVPAGSHSADGTKSPADAGVAYIRSTYVKVSKTPPTGDGPTLNTYVDVVAASDLYATPSLTPDQKTNDRATPIGYSRYRFTKASGAFFAGGHKWVAVAPQSHEGMKGSGIAYICDDNDAVQVGSDWPGVGESTDQPTTTPTDSAGTVTPTQTASAEPTAAAAATPAAIAAEPASAKASSASVDPNWLTAVTSLVFGGLVVFLLYRLESRGA